MVNFSSFIKPCINEREKRIHSNFAFPTSHEKIDQDNSYFCGNDFKEKYDYSEASDPDSLYLYTLNLL